MNSFKSTLSEICKDVASGFPGWSFTSNAFKNKSLKHTDLIVHPGFGMEQGSTALQPAVIIDNKKSMALFKAIMGYELSTSLVNFQVVSHELSHMAENLRVSAWICESKASFLKAVPAAAEREDKIIDITNAQPVLVAMMQDGISFIQRHYDLSSERNFLENLPPRYTTRHINLPYDELERQKGIMMCIVRVLLGDFDFVERYQSSDFRTIYPKRANELTKLIEALPTLRKRFEETGSVI
jgi:hypothetical protein